MNPETLDDVPSKICGFATYMVPPPPPILPTSLSIPSALSASRAYICAYITANCFYCCLMIVWKLS